MLLPQLTPTATGSLRIWDHPGDCEYVIGVDVAEGRKRDRRALERRTGVSYGDDRPDYSAAIVLELVSGLHVATWHGYLSPDEFAGVVAAMGIYYRNALLVVEINGPGGAVIERLNTTLQYDNLYRSRMFNVLDMDPWQPKFGFRTDASSRKVLMMHVHAALNSQQLFTRDERLIHEMRTMEFDDQGTERGRGKNKDDLVFALALALQGRYTSVGLNGGQEAPAPKSGEERYAAQVWEHVKEKQDGKRSSRDRGLWPSRWGAGRRR